MANSTVPDTVQVEIRQALHGKFLENVWNFRQTAGTITPSTLAQLQTAVSEYISEFYKPLFSTDLTFVGLTLKSLDFAQPYELEAALGLTGERAQEGMPVNVAIETTFITGLIGRSFKGRSYASGMGEAAVDGNTFDPTYVTEFYTAWSLLPGILLTEDWEHVVVSRQQDLVVIDPAEATEIVAYSVVPLVRDMGRRLNNS